MTKLILINTCPKCRCACVPIKGEIEKTDNGAENFRINFRCMNSSCEYTTDETYRNIDQNFKKILVNSSLVELLKTVTENDGTKITQFELSKDTVFGTSDEYEIIEKLIASGLLKIDFKDDSNKPDSIICAADVHEKFSDQIMKIINTLRNLQDRINSNDLIVGEIQNGVMCYNPI